MRYKNLKINLNFFLLFFVSAWLLWGGYAQAASIYLEPKSYIENNQIFYELKIFLNTESQSINVLEGELLYPTRELSLDKTINGGSIVNLWLNSPDKSSAGKIIFSGGIPNGYGGEKGFIFSAIFSTPGNLQTGQAEINLQKLRVYLNNGQGTKIFLADVKYFLNFEQVEPEAIPIDTHAPEVFAPYVTQDPLIEDGQWVVIFNAQDKGEGIDHYEVYESGKKYSSEEIIKDGSIKWKTVENLKAYVIQDQSLGSYIYVKAVDKAGNSRVAVVIPARSQKFWQYALENLWIMSALLIIAILIFFLILIFKRRRRKKEGKSDIE